MGVTRVRKSPASILRKYRQATAHLSCCVMHVHIGVALGSLLQKFSVCLCAGADLTLDAPSLCVHVPFSCTARRKISPRQLLYIGFALIELIMLTVFLLASAASHKSVIQTYEATATDSLGSVQEL